MSHRIPKTPKKPRVSYSDDPETVRLSVQCVADSHADRPWLIDSFYQEEADEVDSATPVWLASSTYWRKGESIAQLKRVGSRATLVGNRLVQPDEYKSDPFVLDNGSRSRYSFKCEVCGLSLARKSEVISACFDRLAAAGISEVSLEGLISITK
jgi:hypothetical protein